MDIITFLVTTIVLIPIVVSQTTFIPINAGAGTINVPVSTDYKADYAYDTSPSTCAATAPSSTEEPAMLIINLGSPQPVNNIVITSRTNAVTGQSNGLSDMDTIVVRVSSTNPPTTATQFRCLNIPPKASDSFTNPASNGKATFNCYASGSTSYTGQWVILSQDFRAGAAVYVCDIKVYAVDPIVTTTTTMTTISTNNTFKSTKRKTSIVLPTRPLIPLLVILSMFALSS